jgi:hypothetical protein
VGMLTAEKNRLGTATTKPVRKRLEAHLRWLQKELSGTDRDLEEAIAKRARPSARTKSYCAA